MGTGMDRKATPTLPACSSCANPAFGGAQGIWGVPLFSDNGRIRLGDWF